MKQERYRMTRRLLAKPRRPCPACKQLVAQGLEYLHRCAARAAKKEGDNNK
jgi:hypothetical protein